MFPFTIDPALLARRMAAPGVTSDLADVEIISILQLLDFFMLGDHAVAEFGRSGKLNTDNHPRLEFLATRTLRRKRSFIDMIIRNRLALLRRVYASSQPAGAATGKIDGQVNAAQTP